MPTFKTPEEYITGAYVVEGQVMGVTNRGGKVTLGSKSSKYKAAGVNGNTLMIVSHSGKGYGPIVEVYNTNIEGRCVGAMDHKTTISSAKGIVDDDSVGISSFQVGGPDNFTIQLSDGVVFTHSLNGGRKTNASNGRKTNKQRQSIPDESGETHNTSQEDSGHSALDPGAGFFQRVEHNLSRLFDEPINGPWDKISVGLSAVVGAFVGVFLTKMFGGINETAQIVIFLSTPILFGSLGYKMRNALAKVLIRSWYGIPLVALGYFLMTQVDQQIGIWTIVVGTVVWFWPFWPLALGFLVIGALLLGAAGAGINQANREHMERSRR